MPCTDGRTNEDIYREVNAELKENLDEVTELLCFALNKVESGSLDLFYTLKNQEFHEEIERDLVVWWEEHKRLDEEERLKRLQENTEKHRRALLMKKFNEAFSDEEQGELRNIL